VGGVGGCLKWADSGSGPSTICVPLINQLISLSTPTVMIWIVRRDLESKTQGAPSLESQINFCAFVCIPLHWWVAPGPRLVLEVRVLHGLCSKYFRWNDFQPPTRPKFIILYHYASSESSYFSNCGVIYNDESMIWVGNTQFRHTHTWLNSQMTNVIGGL